MRKYVACLCVSGVSYCGYLANQSFNPYIDNYKVDSDMELQKFKKELLLNIQNDSYDEIVFEHLRRAPTGQLCKLKWINNTGGNVQLWKDSDTKKIMMAVIRADGKIISDIRVRSDNFPETQIKARVIEGYLVGLSTDGYYYSGKGKYPVYEYN